MIAAFLLAALFVLAVLGYVSWWVAAPILVVAVLVVAVVKILAIAAVAAAQQTVRRNFR